MVSDDASQRLGVQSLAYVLFTSGSTGKPKGVMLSQDNAASSAKIIAEKILTKKPPGRVVGPTDD